MDNNYLINSNATVKEALSQLNLIESDNILFVVDEDLKLLGSLTDGDIRRGLIKGIKTNKAITNVMELNPKFISIEKFQLEEIIYYRKLNLKIIPIVNNSKQVIRLLNLNKFKSFLPIDAVIMAGGKGKRLLPLTTSIPKPLIKVGGIPIIEHNINLIKSYGIENFKFSLGYLSNKLIKFLTKKKYDILNFMYAIETKPLGTIGGLKLFNDFQNNSIFIINSDILTNINIENFYKNFIDNDADISVATIPHKISIPFAVIEKLNNSVVSLKEKPIYDFECNAGIYLIKKSVVKRIPNNKFYNTTDLISQVIRDNGKVISYPIKGYWLDIGSHQDLEKANREIKSLNLND